MIEAPLKGRNPKPRSSGITMLIDKGLTARQTRDLVETYADLIDFIKLAFGTTAIYPPEILAQKIDCCKEHGVAVYPGGTFFEIAFWENQSAAYFRKVKDLGFEWVEISEGTLTLKGSERIKAIRAAIDYGLNVITEAGKKDPLQQPEAAEIIETAENDLREGAVWVIIEGRESGTGIGIFDREGQIMIEKLSVLTKALPIDRIIWEAPHKNQQAQLINDFGPNVNLGNINPQEVLALEALRRGYRNDTWKFII
ncbi:MAG: phosphosulfolactate synthase [Firmicutes bacterium]|nr:phosphosulfolactate synthase [Bacillota bacterium]